MKKHRGHALHKAAPANRRHTPMITGDADFDCAISKCKNKDVPGRLSEHVGGGNAYGSRTGYNGYSGPGRDD